MHLCKCSEGSRTCREPRPGHFHALFVTTSASRGGGGRVGTSGGREWKLHYQVEVQSPTSGRGARPTALGAFLKRNHGEKESPKTLTRVPRTYPFRCFWSFGAPRRVERPQPASGRALPPLLGGSVAEGSQRRGPAPSPARRTRAGVAGVAGVRHHLANTITCSSTVQRCSSRAPSTSPGSGQSQARPARARARRNRQRATCPIRKGPRN